MEFSRVYQFRLYPSRIQQRRLLNQFVVCKEVYNTLLAESKEHFITSKYDFDSLIRDIKATNTLYSQVHSQVLQNVSDRLHKALDNFFRRVKERKQGKNVKAGFPRFKSKVSSITFPQTGFKLLSDKRLQLSKIGSIPLKLHRVPKGKIKTLTIKQNSAGQWYAIFSCEMPEPTVKHSSSERVGIDVGLENFATLSNGEVIANPRYLIQSEARIKLLQRRLSRKIKGSNNRRKAKLRLARAHLHVVNQRCDFLHKTSHALANKYSSIAVEDLNINKMLKTHCLAKSISDASWNSFINFLSYKEVTLGGQVIKSKKTRGSSHRCNKCGHYVESMPLSKRTFTCPNCGLVCHRDLNASLNHLNDTVGLTGISTPVDIKPLRSPRGKVSLMVEAGTINGC